MWFCCSSPGVRRSEPAGFWDLLCLCQWVPETASCSGQLTSTSFTYLFKRDRLSGFQSSECVSSCCMSRNFSPEEFHCLEGCSEGCGSLNRAVLLSKRGMSLSPWQVTPRGESLGASLKPRPRPPWLFHSHFLSPLRECQAGESPHLHFIRRCWAW